ncbi:hypothetical protein CYMTET_49952, partial [Cymbomonas tetramitiformis]
MVYLTLLLLSQVSLVMSNIRDFDLLPSFAEADVDKNGCLDNAEYDYLLHLIYRRASPSSDSFERFQQSKQVTMLSAPKQSGSQTAVTWTVASITNRTLMEVKRVPPPSRPRTPGNTLAIPATSAQRKVHRNTSRVATYFPNRESGLRQKLQPTYNVSLSDGNGRRALASEDSTTNIYSIALIGEMVTGTRRRKLHVCTDLEPQLRGFVVYKRHGQFGGQLRDDVVIDDASEAFTQLVTALQNTSVTVIRLRANVTLNASLPEIYHEVAIYGECGDEEEHSKRCRVSGEGAHRIFSLGAGAALHLEALELRRGFTSGNGSALHVIHANASLVDCTVADNSASGYGGAVHGENARVVCIGCNILRNTAFSGAAMSAHNGSIVVLEAGTIVEANSGDSCTVLVNLSSTLRIADQCQVLQNEATNGHGGGACITVNSRMEVTSSAFLMNSAELAGGGIRVADNCTLVVDDGSQICANYAAKQGGGIHLEDGNSRLVLKSGSNISENGSGQNGGGVSACGVVTLQNSTMNANYAVQESGGTKGGGGGGGGGGALFLRDDCGVAEATLESMEVRWNTASGGGGAVYADKESSVVITNAFLGDNTASTDGGAVYASSKTSVVLINAFLVDNGAEQCGGAIFSNGKVQVTAESHLNSNTAGVSGGGVFGDEKSSIVVSETTIDDNEAAVSGGAVYFAGAAAQFADSSLEGNRVGTDCGAGISFAGMTDSSSMEIERTAILSNYAIGDGAGLCIDGIQHAAYLEVVLTDSRIEENVAESDGGGIWAQKAVIVSRNSKFANNIGGGLLIRWFSQLVLHSSAVTGHTAEAGAGISAVEATVRIQASLITGNLARKVGGGIELYACSVIIDEGSEVVRNTASRLGGGIALSRGFSDQLGDGLTYLLVHNATVASNAATLYSGGGISGMEHCTVELLGANISFNTAGYTGGGLDSVNSTVYVTGRSVITNNTAASGGGISAQGGKSVLEVADSLLLGNAVESIGGAIACQDDGEVLLGRRQDEAQRTWSLPNHATLEYENVTVRFTDYGGWTNPEAASCEGHSGCIQGNTAVYGAALHFSSCRRVTLNDTLMMSNGMRDDAESGTGGSVSVVGLTAGSDAVLESCRLELNIGSGVAVEEGSNVSLTSCEVVDHAAKLGAGLRVDLSSGAVVSNCSFVRCVAEQGGAMHASGSLSVSNQSRFEGNVAQTGGGSMFVDLRGQPIGISQCRFVNNTALGDSSIGDGGGVMMLITSTEEGLDTDLVNFEGLAYEDNSAHFGGAVGFWLPHDLPAAPYPPPCIDCEVVNGSNVAPYGASDGWATMALYLQ